MQPRCADWRAHPRSHPRARARLRPEECLHRQAQASCARLGDALLRVHVGELAVGEGTRQELHFRVDWRHEQDLRDSRARRGEECSGARKARRGAFVQLLTAKTRTIPTGTPRSRATEPRRTENEARLGAFLGCEGDEGERGRVTATKGRTMGENAGGVLALARMPGRGARRARSENDSAQNAANGLWCRLFMVGQSCDLRGELPQHVNGLEREAQ